MKINKKDQIEIEVIKGQIEMEKVSLDRYVKAIVRSAFIENCTGGAYFNDLFHKLMSDGYKEIRKSKKSEKELWDLKRDFFPLFSGKNELENWKSNLEYHKRLINWAKHNLDSLNDEKKEKLVRDCIEQEDLWSEQFNRNSRLYKALKKKTSQSKSKAKKK